MDTFELVPSGIAVSSPRGFPSKAVAVWEQEKRNFSITFSPSLNFQQQSSGSLSPPIWFIGLKRLFLKVFPISTTEIENYFAYPLFITNEYLEPTEFGSTIAIERRKPILDIAYCKPPSLDILSTLIYEPTPLGGAHSVVAFTGAKYIGPSILDSLSFRLETLNSSSLTPITSNTIEEGLLELVFYRLQQRR
jgi:hypothetical protein